MPPQNNMNFDILEHISLILNMSLLLYWEYVISLVKIILHEPINFPMYNKFIYIYIYIYIHMCNNLQLEWHHLMM